MLTQKRRKSAKRTAADLEHENERLLESCDDLMTRFLNLSQDVAEDEFGTDRVKAALDAMPRAPQWVQDAILRADHPYGVLVSWHAGSMN